MKLLRAWRESRRFQALEPARRSIVFYAEDAVSRVHFDPILRELTGELGREVAYLVDIVVMNTITYWSEDREE